MQSISYSLHFSIKTTTFTLTFICNDPLISHRAGHECVLILKNSTAPHSLHVLPMNFEQRIPDSVNTLRTLLAEIALARSICQKGNTLRGVIRLFFVAFFFAERRPSSRSGLTIGEGTGPKCGEIFLPVSTLLISQTKRFMIFFGVMRGWIARSYGCWYFYGWKPDFVAFVVPVH